MTRGSKSYEYRLPPSTLIGPIKDPYKEIRCTPGKYFDGPRDHMNNEFLQSGADKFRRVRNNCARYVSNAVGIVRPVSLHEGYCNCLATHGRIRRRAAEQKVDEMAPRKSESSGTGNRGKREVSAFQVPYACSPCIASGSLLATGGIFNFPVECAKANQRYFEGVGMNDTLPCGVRGFDTPSEPACVNTWIYVGERGMSFAVRSALQTVET